MMKAMKRRKIVVVTRFAATKFTQFTSSQVELISAQKGRLGTQTQTAMRRSTQRKRPDSKSGKGF